MKVCPKVYLKCANSALAICTVCKTIKEMTYVLYYSAIVVPGGYIVSACMHVYRERLSNLS